jgi:glycosyltransferase involved in cell wall biosynthesis
MVTFRVGGTGEVISDGINGVLVPFPEIEMLIGEAAGFFNTEYRLRIRNSTGRYVRERFNSVSIAGEYLALCKKVIREYEGSRSV